MRALAISLMAMTLCAALAPGGADAYRPEETGRPVVNSLFDVALTGYQGWFRCPDDGARLGWVHWSGDGGTTFPVEMWPDMKEYARRYPAAAYTLPDGKPAELYSPMDYATVLTHFRWMKQYGIDGAWLQRFVVGLPGGSVQEAFPSTEAVRKHVQKACAATERIWAIAYDIAAMPPEDIYRTLTADWDRLTAEGVTQDPRYLHHEGKPVVLVWGFYSHEPNNHMSPALGNRLIDYFQARGAFLIGGAGWWWYKDTEPDWVAMYRRLDAICGWNVGNFLIDKDGKRWAETGNYARGKETAGAAGIPYIPVLYPGYSWSKSKPSNYNLLPRMKGEFYWHQWVAARENGFKTVYLAMFDEVDEGTALYKVTNAPPTQRPYVTYEGFPTDWYLRLTREGLRMLRAGTPLSRTIPIRP